jgi:3-dehydroquinate dehydratase/shikimate dehydrogenase
MDVDPICVVIGRTRHRMVQVEIQEAAKQGARFIELRLDFLNKAPDFKRLLEEKPCPLVATVRRPEDGGRWSGSEDARRMLLRQAIVAGFDWVDLETDVIGAIPRYKDVKRIVSYHNMREVPKDLEKIHQAMCGQDADVVKLAVRAQHPGDNLRVLALLKGAPKPTVAFCMGDLGMPSRILAARFGAPFTYGAFNKERNIAPGMLSFEELKKVYFYDQINADTQVYGVVGDPVGHSLSPLIHNQAFRKLGLNAVYLPFRVPRADLANFVKEFEKVPVQGYSVTIPHKETAAALAKNQDPAVAQTQAANTLVRGADGFTAYNTDYQGVLDSLLAHLPSVQHAARFPDDPVPARPPDGQEATLHSKAVLILGAGGIARAVAHALFRQGALLTVSARTDDRARKLAEEVGCRQVDWAARHSVTPCDLVINGTPVGMHPNLDESPLHPSFLKPGLMVFDTVYTPETTLLVKEARNRGCHIITGVDLFVRQAALQFRLFTDRDAPLDLLRTTVKRALSPVTIRPVEEE